MDVLVINNVLIVNVNNVLLVDVSIAVSGGVFAGREN